MSAPLPEVLQRSRAALRVGDAAEARRLLAHVGPESESVDVLEALGTGARVGAAPQGLVLRPRHEGRRPHVAGGRSSVGGRARRGEREGRRAYLAGDGPFQPRAAQNLVVGAFITDFTALVARWAEWAAAEVEKWPDDSSEARLDRAAMAGIARRAGWGPRGRERRAE